MFFLLIVGLMFLGWLNALVADPVTVLVTTVLAVVIFLLFDAVTNREKSSP